MAEYKHFKVSIAYNGYAYWGWQTQSKTITEEKEPTIQGAILLALQKIAKYKYCNISAVSRTDAGVHAKGQLAKISINRDISAQNLSKGLNSLLPSDIRILTCAECPAKFNPCKIKTNKEYHYYFSLVDQDVLLLKDCSYQLNQAIDLEQLKQACQLFVGEHNFAAFSSVDKKQENYVRQIDVCELHSVPANTLTEELYYLKLAGPGFLKHMVRYIAGALFELAKGNLTSEDIKQALSGKKTKKLSAKSKAKGLHLMAITHDDL